MGWLADSHTHARGRPRGLSLTRAPAGVQAAEPATEQLVQAPAPAAAPAAQPVPARKQPVVPPQMAAILFRVSFTSLLSFLVAAALRVHDGMAVTGAVFLCSTNHWRRPVYGWRRRMDVCNTVMCLAYQTWRCFAAGGLYTAGYLSFTYAAGGCFFLGLYFDRFDLRKGTIAHALVHILANVGNVILYVGLSRLPGRITSA